MREIVSTPHVRASRAVSVLFACCVTHTCYASASAMRCVYSVSFTAAVASASAAARNLFRSFLPRLRFAVFGSTPPSVAGLLFTIAAPTCTAAAAAFTPTHPSDVASPFTPGTRRVRCGDNESQG